MNTSFNETWVKSISRDEFIAHCAENLKFVTNAGEVYDSIVPPQPTQEDAKKVKKQV